MKLNSVYLCSKEWIMNEDLRGDTMRIMESIGDSLATADSGLLSSPFSTSHLNLSEVAPGFLLKGPENGIPIWYFVVLILLPAAYIFARIIYGNLFRNVLISSVRFNHTQSLYNDNSLITRQTDLVLIAFYYVSGGLFLFILETKLNIYPYGQEGFLLFIGNVLFLLIYSQLRGALFSLSAHLFEIRGLVKEYQYHLSAYNKLIGLFFLALNILLIYTSGILNDAMFYLSYIMICLMFGMKALRGVTFTLKKQIFSFYLFLYLCALEIVPLLLIMKWISLII